MQFEFEITCSNNKIFSFYLNIYKSCREAMLSIYCPRNSFICCHIIAVYFHIWCTRFKYLFVSLRLAHCHHQLISFLENIWCVWSRTSYGVDKWRCHHADGRTIEQTSESATQSVDTVRLSFTIYIYFTMM